MFGVDLVCCHFFYVYLVFISIFSLTFFSYNNKKLILCNFHSLQGLSGVFVCDVQASAVSDGKIELKIIERPSCM